MNASQPESTSKSKLTSRLVGGLIFAVAVAAVFLIDRNPPVEEEPQVIRPIKTMVIESSSADRGRKYPGRVRASQQVDLAFEVPGIIIEVAKRRGDQVKQHEVLMRLDPRDYENDYNAAVAERDRAKAQLDRMEEAAKLNAVSKQHVDDARAGFRQADAEVAIRKKALEDTELVARFDGIIGDTFVEEFQTVRATQPILSLNNISNIRIDVSIPEGDAAEARPDGRDQKRMVAVFDSFPDDEPYPVDLIEFTTQADPLTQTFTATAEMERPKNRTLLPGMTATVLFYSSAETGGQEAEVFPVPLDAAPMDGVGQYYVWKLRETGNGTYTVHRADVEVGETKGNEIEVWSGLAKGDRIALAGVRVLTEGREVRLLTSNFEPNQGSAMGAGSATF